MKKSETFEMEFIVDKLTNSIENTISGDVFATELARFTIKDSKQSTKKNGWSFNWKSELDNDINEVYKLTITGNPDIVAFTSKTKLISHYEETLGAFHIGGHRMIIPTDSAKILVEKYFKT